jgi:hypothetical protein
VTSDIGSSKKKWAVADYTVCPTNRLLSLDGLNSVGNAADDAIITGVETKRRSGARPVRDLLDG